MYVSIHTHTCIYIWFVTHKYASFILGDLCVEVVLLIIFTTHNLYSSSKRTWLVCGLYRCLYVGCIAACMWAVSLLVGWATTSSQELDCTKIFHFHKTKYYLLTVRSRKPGLYACYVAAWWVMSDESWVMSDEWWVMSHESWVKSDPWWVMSDEWWVMSDESWVMSHESWVNMHTNRGQLMRLSLTLPLSLFPSPSPSLSLSLSDSLSFSLSLSLSLSLSHTHTHTHITYIQSRSTFLFTTTKIDRHMCAREHTYTHTYTHSLSLIHTQIYH